MDAIFAAIWYLLSSLWSGHNKRDAVQRPLVTFARSGSSYFEKSFRAKPTPRHCPECGREYSYVLLCTVCGVELQNTPQSRQDDPGAK